MGEIQYADKALQVIYVMAFRYALHRSTSAPMAFIDAFCKYGMMQKMYEVFLEQFVSDITHGIKTGLIDETERWEWDVFRERVKMELERRKEDGKE